MNKELITCITPTGTRPEALGFCERYLARQTYDGPIQWIIVDDSPEQKVDERKVPLGWEQLRKSSEKIYTVNRGPKKAPMSVEVHIGPKKWHPGINTQRPNMDEGIKFVQGDYVFVIEDDDWYHPEYLETFRFFLQKYSVVGEGCNKYYALKERKYWTLGNHFHASLCSTAMKRMALPLLEEAVNDGQIYPDISFWKKCMEEWKIPHVLCLHINLGIGMKQLPGRKGIGGGHTVNNDVFRSDPGFDILKSWIGAEDTQNYVKLMQAEAQK